MGSGADPGLILGCCKMGVKALPLSSSYVNARVRWSWMTIKNPLLFSIVWVWVGFRWYAKVKILLIWWQFLVAFWLRPPPTHLLTPSCFGIWKVFRWYISGPSFIYVWFVVLEFWNFKCFHTSRKYDFRLLLGGFLLLKNTWN